MAAELFASIIGVGVSEARALMDRMSARQTATNYAHIKTAVLSAYIAESSSRGASARTGASVSTGANANAAASFTDHANSLPELNFSAVTEGSGGVAKSRIGDFNVEKWSGAGGTFGKVYISNAGAIKVIEFPHRDKLSNEKNIRNVYIEVFIGAVLASDPTMGSRVCRPIRLFRDVSIVRESSRPRKVAPSRGAMSATGASKDPALEKPPIKFYILMEPVREFYKGLEVPLSLSDATFVSLLVELGETLAYFRRVYNYSHRDLHIGNVMASLTEPRHLKLIDFGFSILTLPSNGKIYRQVNIIDDNPAVENRPGYDLAIFITTVLETMDITSDLKTFLIENTTRFWKNKEGTDEMLSLVDYAKRHAPRWKDKHFKQHFPFYYNQMNTASIDYLNRIEILDPENFAAIIREEAARPPKSLVAEFCNALGRCFTRRRRPSISRLITIPTIRKAQRKTRRHRK